MPRIWVDDAIYVIILREHIDENNPENHTIIQMNVTMHPTKGTTVSMEIPITHTCPSIATGVPPESWQEEFQRCQPAYDMVIKERDGRMYVFTLGPVSCVPKKWNFEECTSSIGMTNKYTKVMNAMNHEDRAEVILRSYCLTSLAEDTRLVYIHGRHFYCGFLKQMHLLQHFADRTKGQSPSNMFQTLHGLLEGRISRQVVKD